MPLGATISAPERACEMAIACEAAAMAVDKQRITNSEGADFDSSSGRVVLGNSHGFIGEYRSSSFSLAVSPIATDPASGGMPASENMKTAITPAIQGLRWFRPARSEISSSSSGTARWRPCRCGSPRPPRSCW